MVAHVAHHALPGARLFFHRAGILLVPDRRQRRADQIAIARVHSFLTLLACLVGVAVNDFAAFFRGLDAELFQSFVLARHSVGNGLDSIHDALAHRARGVAQ